MFNLIQRVFYFKKIHLEIKIFHFIIKNMLDNINFITTNSGKVKSLERHIRISSDNIKVNQISKLDIIEPQADTIEEVAKAKVKQAKKLFKNKPFLIQDSGLFIPEIDGFPGPYTKYFINKLKCEGMLTLINNYAKKRYGFFKHVLIYVDENNENHIFSDKYEIFFSKEIASVNNKNSWSELDKIYMPKGSNKIAALMNDEEIKEVEPLARKESSWDQLIKFINS